MFVRGAVVAWLALVVAVFGDAPLFMEGQPIGAARSVSSVHARKGVEYVASSTNATAPIANVTASSIAPSAPSVAPTVSSTAPSASSVPPSDSSTAPSSSSAVPSASAVESTSRPSSSTTTTQRPKPHKPTITIGVEEAPSVRPLPPKSSSSIPPPAQAVSAPTSVSASGAIAYVPIVVAVAAVPLLLFFAWQTVRRGKDAWRNRHYRRMDYLIEGMYNE